LAAVPPLGVPAVTVTEIDWPVHGFPESVDPQLQAAKEYEADRKFNTQIANTIFILFPLIMSSQVGNFFSCLPIGELVDDLCHLKDEIKSVTGAV
jgi:hypothetical protein